VNLSQVRISIAVLVYDAKMVRLLQWDGEVAHRAPVALIWVLDTLVVLHPAAARPAAAPNLQDVAVRNPLVPDQPTLMSTACTSLPGWTTTVAITDTRESTRNPHLFDIRRTCTGSPKRLAFLALQI
jgi:hypothetical protein